MSPSIRTACCIVGGGPAGMMLGFLLARAGVDVIVLEKHADFLRDFRGDTVHPSTLEVMHDLGLLEEFLRRPHQEAAQLRGRIGGVEVTIADFSHLSTHCRFIALMPQWDFLNFLVEQGRRYPAFQVKMQAEVTGLIEADGRVVGVRAQTPEGPLEVHADLVVGADGRQSVVRERAGLEIQNLGAPMDVFWMSLSRRSSDPDQTFGCFDRGKIMVLLNREDYWQGGYVIPKGQAEEIRQKGLGTFRQSIAELAPFLRDRVDELKDWEQIKLLTVKVDRLRRWYRPGLLCIGDAAHAMSPIGGVGINLAIQDAVAAANRLAAPLKNHMLQTADLAAVQRRRIPPTAITQWVQVFVQKRVISRILADSGPTSVPWGVQWMQRWPWLQRIPARLVGVGFRPEHPSIR